MNNQELDIYFEKVRVFFEGDTAKAIYRFSTPNPMLGNTIPLTMIQEGREDKLYKMIDILLEEGIQ